MKLLFIVAVLALAGCNSADKTENAHMPGAYKMLSQSVKNSKIDTSSSSMQQLKIYTDDYMMYANFNPADSISGFGIGTYTSNKDTVTENVMYSANDTSKNENGGSFKLLIEKTANGYKQVIPDIEFAGEPTKLTEEYSAEKSTTKSPLDGAWKEVKAYWIKGTDSTITTNTQFKIYHDGYFIFGHTYSDSANVSHTGMGYGSFAMTGNNKSKETVMASTYYQIRGKDVDVEIEMVGNDEYKQTIINEDGTKGVEIYQRLKK